MVQGDFSGGMNLFDDDTAIAANEYALAFNVRNRRGKLEEIRRPLEDTILLPGKKQGIYSFDKYLLTFVAGKAYYKDVTSDAAWTQITLNPSGNTDGPLQLDPTVNFIYTQAVPDSSINYVRKLIAAAQVAGTNLDKPVNFDILQLNGATNAGLVVQDGINQPWIIYGDATARKLNTYAQWEQAFHGVSQPREYVPVMKQMAFLKGILFGIAPDGVTLLRSVSGRPLDFVINVDTDGHKGGDAFTTSHGVSTNETTCLQALDDGGLFLGTTKGSFILDLNYNDTIFAEPRFILRSVLPSGVVNQFSFLELLKPEGLTLHQFVDFDGIRVYQTLFNDKNEGRNSLFSARIRSALAAKQSINAAILFDDYSIFSLKTIYANYNLIGIFDNLRNCWACFDNYPNGITFKQFAVAYQSDNPTVYGITETGIFKLFSDPENFGISIVRLRAEVQNSAKAQAKLENVYVVLSDGVFASNMIITNYVNAQSNKTVTHNLREASIEQKRFNFIGSSIGWKNQLQLTWQNGGQLEMVETAFSGKNLSTPAQQVAESYAD